MPLISVQEILNAAVSASGVGVKVRSEDASLLRVSALGVNVADVSNSDAGDFRVSSIQGDAANLNVSAKSDSAALFRVSSYDGGYGYTNISTSAQTLVKSGAGILGKVAINSTLTSAVRGYDNTVSGGTVLFTIAAGTTGRSFDYAARFTTGLVVSTGAAADNVTVMYN